MNKHLTLITFLFFVVKVWAQECNYTEYFSLTAKARQQFNEANYHAANDTFKAAFSTVDFPLGADLSLALTIATKRKDEKWAETISVQLAKGGIPLKFFDNLKKFIWYNKFKDDFGKYHEYYQTNFNVNLKHKLLEVKKNDLEWNEKFHSWRVRHIEMTKEELLEGYTRRVTKFEEMCKAHGFPCEQEMGYYYDKKQVLEYPTGVLLIHIYQSGVLLYVNEIDKLVCKGYLTPNDAAMLKTIRGFGNSTGIEQEVNARIKKFRPQMK